MRQCFVTSASEQPGCQQCAWRVPVTFEKVPTVKFSVNSKMFCLYT